MEPRFCGLLASNLVVDERTRTNSYAVIWTFDPNVVFTAIQYLMARINVQKPQERDRFDTLVNSCTPHISSLKLALAFTTKVTMLMQRQTELEMATNRISSAISSTLELEAILQSAVEEVGRALNARTAAVVLWQEGTNLPESMSIYERPEAQEDGDGKDEASLGAKAEGAGNIHKTDHSAASTSEPANAGKQDSISQESAKEDNQQGAVTCGSLEVPISYRNTVI